MNNKFREYAFKKEILILGGFIAATGLAYYFWLSKQKKNIPKNVSNDVFTTQPTA